tara:strand:- start:888 stop:1124 length:237 start_codon:yes stop_codon:yes gene_type:complete
LAIKFVDAVIGSREQYGAKLYSYYIDKDEPTSQFFRVVDLLYPISMVKSNPVTFVASMSRFATVDLLNSGKLNASEKD